MKLIYLDVIIPQNSTRPKINTKNSNAAVRLIKIAFNKTVLVDWLWNRTIDYYGEVICHLIFSLWTLQKFLCCCGWLGFAFPLLTVIQIWYIKKVLNMKLKSRNFSLHFENSKIYLFFSLLGRLLFSKSS